MHRIPVIVLTPIRNEKWILRPFLTLCSQFADCIIVADQMSDDGSRQIAEKFEKVVLIENQSKEYDEGYRQQLLLEKARQLYTGKKILLALDADEIITADSLISHEWRNLHSLDEGTVLAFEKPDILNPLSKCIRHQSYFNIGYIDDGQPHVGSRIHSPRIPFATRRGRYEAQTIRFMHFALTRPIEYRSRQRLYSMIENVKNVDPLYQRLLKYSPRLNNYLAQHEVVQTPNEWLTYVPQVAVELSNLPTTELNSFAKRCFELFEVNGERRFFFDDVWDVDWNALRLQFGDSILSTKPVRSPGILRRLALDVLIVMLKCFSIARSLKQQKENTRRIGA